MRKILVLGAASVVAAVGTTACANEDITGPVRMRFVATLSGARENPPNTSPATGTANYEIVGDTLTFTVTVQGLTANAAGAHLHVGDSTQNGPIIIGFQPQPVRSGVAATGRVILSQPIVAPNGTSITRDSLMNLLNTRRSYTNVHTSAFPGGEVRGQVGPQ